MHDIDFFQEWQAADRAACAAEKAVLADSLRSIDAMGNSPAAYHLEKARRRRAIANDLFQMAMKQWTLAPHLEEHWEHKRLAPVKPTSQTRVRTMTPASIARRNVWKSTEGATRNEIIELERLGFKVEDLGVEYGPAHQGAFRWVNIVAGEFQQDGESHSEAEAWAAAKVAAVANERTIR